MRVASRSSFPAMPALLIGRSAAGATAAAAAAGQRQLRCKWSGKSRFNLIRERAREQHVDYFRQMKPPRPARRVEVDPKLVLPQHEMKHVFGHPRLVEQPPEEQSLLSPRRALQPEYQGLMHETDFKPFGSIDVSHGDIFQAKADAVLVPMTPNLMPYRGLGLEVLDRGGREMVQDIFAEAQEVWKKKAGGEDGEALKAGDTFAVRARGMAADHVLFVIVPWFWQGSPLDAAKRFRYAVRRALLDAGVAKGGFSSIALPHLGAGVYGYEPRASSSVLMEEAVEALLQIEASTPNYALRRISFVDSRQTTAEQLGEALIEVSHRWLPDRKLTTAAQFWSSESRRLIMLPEHKGNFFQKRYRVKFKRRSGVIRNERRHYLSNIRPYLWRAHRVRQPPPMLVYKQSGAPAAAELQPKARPYYFRGVSHWLFPSVRSGFHQLRRSGHGQWVARLRQYRLREDTRPRI